MIQFGIVEESFENLYGTLIIPVILLDAENRLVKANRAFCDLTLARLNELCSQNLDCFFHRFRGGSLGLEDIPTDYITEVTRLDGKEIPVVLNHVRLTGDDGRRAGGLGFITDLRDVDAVREKLSRIIIENDPLNPQLIPELTTSLLEERKRLKQDAREAKAFLENVAESCGDGIAIADGMGKVTHVNEAFVKILQKEKQAILGCAYYELGPGAGSFRSTAGETITLDQAYVDEQVGYVEKIRRLEDGGKIENWQWHAFTGKGAFTGPGADAGNRCSEKEDRPPYAKAPGEISLRQYHR